MLLLSGCQLDAPVAATPTVAPAMTVATPTSTLSPSATSTPEVAAETATPAPSETPSLPIIAITATATVMEAATATEEALNPLTLIEPFEIGCDMEGGGWSPDSGWYAYWYSAPEDCVAFRGQGRPAELRILNAQSGLVCAMPALSAAENEPRLAGWDGNMLEILIGPARYAALPCQESSIALLEEALEPSVYWTQYTPPERSISPNQAFRVEHQFPEGNRYAGIVTRFYSHSSDTLLHEVVWDGFTYVDACCVAGWASDEQYLIEESNLGPLLIDPNEGVIELYPRLTGQPYPTLTDGNRFRSVLYEHGQARNEFLVSLTFIGDESLAPPNTVYFVADGQTLTLPEDWYLVRASAAGNVVLAENYQSETGRRQFWVRAYGDFENEWTPLAEDVNRLSWDEGDRSYLVTRQDTLEWIAWPQRTLILDAQTAGFNPQTGFFSPDGLSVIVWGDGTEGRAFFLLHSGLESVGSKDNSDHPVEGLGVANVIDTGCEIEISGPAASGAWVSTGGWSPDGRWFAYWINSGDQCPEAAGPYEVLAGELRLYDAESETVCPLPALSAAAGEFRQGLWQADGTLRVLIGTARYLLSPCDPDSIAEIPLDPNATPTPENNWFGYTTAPDLSISPDGAFRVENEYPAEAQFQSIITRFYRESDNLLLHEIEWVGYPYVDGCCFGSWASPNQYLIRESHRGPLLIDPQEGEIRLYERVTGLELPAVEEGIEPAALAAFLLIPGSVEDEMAFYFQQYGRDDLNQIYYVNGFDQITEIAYPQNWDNPQIRTTDSIIAGTVNRGDGGYDTFVLDLKADSPDWESLADDVLNFYWSPDMSSYLVIDEDGMTWQSWPTDELLLRQDLEDKQIPFFRFSENHLAYTIIDDETYLYVVEKQN
ncbi:MAG: hypothetical protein AAF633_14270 [Chloroflexota bacterium]